MKKAMKVLFLLLVTVIAVTPFAAAGGRQSASTSSASGSNEHMVITYAHETTVVDVNNDAWSKRWCDKFNFEWEIIPLPEGGGSTEMIRIWASAGDLPDLTDPAGDYFNIAELTSWAEQKMIYRMPDNWRTRWPLVSGTQTVTQADKHIEGVLGGTYVLLKPLFSEANIPVQRLINHWGVWFRADWAKAVGFETRTTGGVTNWKATELMEYARRIKAQDPGRVGPALAPIAVSTSLLPLVFVAPNSLYSNNWAQYYKNANGQYQWGPAHPDTLIGLKLWRQAYDEGLLHREFYLLPTGRDLEAIYNSQGTTAVMMAAGMATVAMRQASFLNSNFGVDEDAVGFAFMLNEDGKPNNTEIVNFYGIKFFRPNIPQAKFERIMDILDYSATQEAQNLIRLGFEGEHWRRDASGNIVGLLPPNMQIPQIFPSIQPNYTSLLIRPDDFGLVNPTFPQRWKDLARNQYVQKTQMTDANHFAPLDFDAQFYDSPAMRRAVMNLPEEYASIVLAGPNVETSFNNWVREKMPIIQPVLNELNAIRRR